MLPSIAKIAELLGGDAQGGQVLCPGPGHSAADRSLSVKLDKDDAEGFVVHSFARDDFKACRDHVRAKLGLPEPKKNGGGKAAWTLLSEHIYLDEHGERFLKVRKCRDGDGKKQYPQYHWDGNGWAKGKPEGPKIPYRLPQMLAASTAAIVYFVEGEKDCDNLAKLGFVATTASEGAAAKWDPALTTHFKDRHVVILPDADRPGRAHAQKVAKAINDAAASVRILDLYPERHDGSDVSNWISDDTAGAKLAKLAKGAPLWEPGGTTGAVEQVVDGSGDAVPPPAKPEKVDRSEGAPLLEDVRCFLARFVIYPSEHAHVAHVLWIAHAHLMGAWESTPRFAFLSPEPASGKTRSMEVSELLVPDPVAAVNVTPAYLFRKVGGEDGPPTILFDEIDTVFGAKAKEHEELRALLNSGHRRGAVAGRCVVRGATVETEEISSYSAVALAGLGWLPDTILSRSVIVRMRRRAADEKIEAFRRRVHAPIGEALRRRLAGWAATILDEATEARPEMPVGVDDRAADMWEPLLAVADIAGDEWPTRAREAAKALVKVAGEVEPSLNIRLLADLRTVFGAKEQMATKEILAALCALEDAPWSDLKGKPLSDNQLARRLKQYEVKSKGIRVGTTTPGAIPVKTCTTSGGATCPPYPINPQHPQQPQHRRLSKTLALRPPNPKPQQMTPSRNTSPSPMLRLLRVMLRLVAAPSMQEMPMKWALLRLLRLLHLFRGMGAAPSTSSAEPPREPDACSAAGAARSTASAGRAITRSTRPTSAAPNRRGAIPNRRSLPRPRPPTATTRRRA
jgi:5S rRNA maturation endonuclease (ribonuclease M5)